MSHFYDGSLTDYIEKLFKSLINKYTGAGMTGEQQEVLDTQLRNQQILNEEDYVRKEDFYNRYESPAAMISQYRQAGLNPGLMYGGAASTSASGGIGAGSAGSAPASGGDLISAITSLVGMQRANRQQAIDAGFKSTELRIRDEYNKNYGKYLEAMTQGQNITNEYLPHYLSLRNENLEKDAALKERQSSYFAELCSSENVRRDLMRSGINVNDTQAVVNTFQSSILEAQSRYSDKYFSAVAKYEDAVAVMADIDKSIYSSTKDVRLKAAEAELCDIVIKAAMDARVYQGEGFEKIVEGKMNDKEKTQALISVIKTVIGAGAAVAIAGMKVASRSIVPPSVDHSPQYSIDPTSIGTTMF